MGDSSANANSDTEIPLADDGEETLASMSSSRSIKPAQPLPRDEDQEEKARLITQILELQNTLDDLSQRVDCVKEESLKLRSENQVLGQYIQNLMAASSVFQLARGSGGQQHATQGASTVPIVSVTRKWKDERTNRSSNSVAWSTKSPSITN